MVEEEGPGGGDDGHVLVVLGDILVGRLREQLQYGLTLGNNLTEKSDQY